MEEGWLSLLCQVYAEAIASTKAVLALGFTKLYKPLLLFFFLMEATATNSSEKSLPLYLILHGESKCIKDRYAIVVFRKLMYKQQVS